MLKKYTILALATFALFGCQTNQAAKLIDISAPKASFVSMMTLDLKDKSNKYANDLQPAIHGDWLIAANGTWVRGYRQGQLVWTVNVNEPIASGVSFDELSQTAVVVTRASGVVAINAQTGDMLWQSRLPTSVQAQALIAGNRVLLNANDGNIYALNLQTGQTVWRFAAQRTGVGIQGGAKPLRLDGNTAVFGAADGRIYALDIEQGNALWSRRVGVAGAAGLWMSDVDGTPLVVGNTLYVTSASGELAAFDLSTGQTRFLVHDFASSEPLVSFGSVLVGISDRGLLTAFDAQSGKKLWQNNALTRRSPSNAVVLGQYVVVGDGEGFLHLFDKNGDLVGRTQLKGSITSLQVQNNLLYTQTKEGMIAALRVQ